MRREAPVPELILQIEITAPPRPKLGKTHLRHLENHNETLLLRQPSIKAEIL